MKISFFICLLGDFKREDLAAAVVYLLCCDIAQVTLEEAMKQKITNIVLCGTMVNHEVVRKGITTATLGRTLSLPPVGHTLSH